MTRRRENPASRSGERPDHGDVRAVQTASAAYKPRGVAEVPRPTQTRASTAHQRNHDEVARWVQRLRQHIRSTYMESTQALVAAVDARDPYTRAHSVTVAAYADAIARHMNIPARTITTIRAAGLLHDIGKIGVPDAILTKPGPLDDAEFALMKRHPQTAVDILGHVSFLREERPLILHHHERFDGNGYPAGLSKERIPLGARVLAVADALETMLSARSYKAPFAVGRVRDELVSGAGSQFDPNVVDATLRWLDETPTDLTASDTHYEPRPLNTTEGEP